MNLRGFFPKSLQLDPPPPSGLTPTMRHKRVADVSFSFEKGSNGQNNTFSDYHHSIKK